MLWLVVFLVPMLTGEICDNHFEDVTDYLKGADIVKMMDWKNIRDIMDEMCRVCDE